MKAYHENGKLIIDGEGETITMPPDAPAVNTDHEIRNFTFQYPPRPFDKEVDNIRVQVNKSKSRTYPVRLTITEGNHIKADVHTDSSVTAPGDILDVAHARELAEILLEAAKYAEDHNEL